MEFRITTIELEEIDNATLQKGQGEIKKNKDQRSLSIR